MNIVYLDNNATTRTDPEVVRAMIPFLGEHYGNPSSVHRLGQFARQAINVARRQVASAVGARERDIVFTGGGTEAGNSVIRGLLAMRQNRKKIITTTVEHSATRELTAVLEKEGFEIVRIPVNQSGLFDLDMFRSAITDDTALVTMIWANNETGVIFPADEIAKQCAKFGVPIHCDATQVIGKMPVNLADCGFSCTTFSPHKYHGPKGVGVICLSRGTKIKPAVVGGPQENNHRGGTENVAGIVGSGLASELASKRLSDLPRVTTMRDRLENEILRAIPDCAVNGTKDRRLCNTTNIGFARLEAEAILISLSEQGICASAGAACSSGSLEPSPVLLAMGIPEIYAHGSIRFSFSHENTDADVDRTLEILVKVIAKLRKVLPI